VTALLLGLLLAQTYYTPAEAQALFQEANAAYGRGEYAGARERYERLLAHGNAGPDVLYNLGTTALAEGRLGEAVLNLERARRQGGSEADVDANLALARTRQLDQVLGEEIDEPIGFRLADALPPLFLKWAFAGSWALAWLLLALGQLWGKGKARLFGRVVLLVVALPVGALLGLELHALRTVHEGVVMAPSVAARELPQEGARVVFEIHAGLKVRLLKQLGDYARIRLPNGVEAWADRNAISQI
jgi:tetratricopeptide (TPR) repeat protein